MAIARPSPVDIEAARCGTPKRRSAVVEFIREVEAGTHAMVGRHVYRYPLLVEFLLSEGVCDIPGRIYFRIAARLMELADGQAVYLADGRVYLEGELRAEFPEFVVFQIAVGDAFVAPDPAFPRLFVETKKFASLRALSTIRREIRKVGVNPQHDAREVVGILLGID